MNRLLTVLMIVFIAQMLSAQITLQEAVDMAITNNKELKMAKEDVDIARYGYNDVRGQLFPQINLQGSYTLSKNYLPDTIAKDTEIEEGSLNAQVQLQQLLYSGGKLINGIKALDRVKVLQQTRYELELQNIIIEVVNAYYNLYLAQEGLNIQRQALRSAEQHFQRVQNLFAQGLVSEYEKLRAELEVSRLIPQVLNYEHIENIAGENFKRITGLSGNTTLNPSLEEKTSRFVDFNITLDEALETAERD
ncbi:MAG: TolC family protein, partial [Candidatus Cloacimonetes bacterium]|nr:TolC family protein [Candidatus Cloacimonadota bacterium]